MQNSECYKVEAYRGPVCGQIDKFTYDVLDKDKISWNNKASNISVNITYVPYTRPTNSDRKPLYYVALYGDALPYDSSEEVSQQLLESQFVSDSPVFFFISFFTLYSFKYKSSPFIPLLR